MSAFDVEAIRPKCLCGECKTCVMRAYQREYYADPEKRARKQERAAAFRERHKDRLNEEGKIRSRTPEHRAKENERRRKQTSARRLELQQQGLLLPRVTEDRARETAKKRAHWAVKRAKRKGSLAPMPCEVCGSMRAEAHHDDYSKPLDVIWLCRLHHQTHHARLRREQLKELRDQAA